MVDEANVDPALLKLARNSLEHWGIAAASLDLHWQRENLVFRLEAVDGRAYALRVHRAGYHDLAALESEHAWTSALAASGLSVPVAVETREGGPYATVALPGTQETRYVGLVEWIHGPTLADHMGPTPARSEVARYYEQLGGLIAEFHDASQRWSPPQGFKRHAWDADGLAGERPFWGRFWEIETATDAERAQLRTIRDRVLESLSALDRGPDVFGMIHADLNPSNVMVDGDALSVIDFDDAGFGWYAFDLAVAVWQQMDFLQGSPIFELSLEALQAGYRAKRPDCEYILNDVPLFLLVRSLMLLRWAEDRPEAGYLALIPVVMAAAFEQAAELEIL